MDIQYCRAGVADIDAIIDRRIEFLESFKGKQTDELNNKIRSGLRTYFAKNLINNQCLYWLAKADGKVVGTGGLISREYPPNILNPDGRQGYIFGMYTVPEYRRKGISSTILTNLIAAAKELGIHMYELHASEVGEYVYKKNGFELYHEPTYRRYDY